MKEIKITSQAEFDKLNRIEADESVVIECEVKLLKIVEIYGKLRIERKTDSSWDGKKNIRLALFGI